MVVERSVSLADGLELVVEVEHYLAQGHVVVEFHAVCGDVVLAHEGAAAVKAELHYGAEELGLADDLRADVRLLDVVYEGGCREAGRIVDVQHVALHCVYFIGYVGDGGYYVHIELAEQALLHYLKMQQAKETAPEAADEGERTLGLVHKGGVVELELLKHGAQFLELVGLNGIHTRENHRLHFLKAGDCLVAGIFV